MMVMKPRLLCLEFDKQSAFGMRAFKEGQYVFVNCPTVRKYEWHPFTISSPPDKGTFTLHIQTQGDGSWTLGVHDYLLVLTNLHKTHGHYYEFESTDAEGNVQKGRVVGPDGTVRLVDLERAPASLSSSFTYRPHATRLAEGGNARQVGLETGGR